MIILIIILASLLILACALFSLSYVQDKLSINLIDEKIIFKIAEFIAFVMMITGMIAIILSLYQISKL
jgi:hypothetical protein